MKNKIVLEMGEDGFNVFETSCDINKEDLSIDDMDGDEICFIGRDDDSHEAIVKLLKALNIEYIEV